MRREQPQLTQFDGMEFAHQLGVDFNVHGHMGVLSVWSIRFLIPQSRRVLS